MTPPRLSAWLLESTLSAADRDAVAGDLWEEFRVHIVPRRGVLLARWWYRWQVTRSLAPLFFRSFERATALRASAAITGAALVSVLPVTLLVLLRTFVLQQVPLKATADPSAAFLVLLVSVALATSVGGVAVAVRLLNAEACDR